MAPRRIAQKPEQLQRTVAVPDPTPPQPIESPKTVIARLQSRREARIRARLAQQKSRMVATKHAAAQPDVVTARREIAAQQTVLSRTAGRVSSVEIEHDGYFSRIGWEKIIIRLLDIDGNRVTHPQLNQDLAMQTAFGGKTSFRQAILSRLDFVDGEAVVFALPSRQDRRPIVLRVFPYNVLSRPMQFKAGSL